MGPEVWAPLFGTRQLMVVGVDVSHGLTGSKKPSIAAVVASRDAACTRYPAALLQQTPGHEVVLGMQEAMQQHLQDYRAARGQLPEAMLVFRDGVSDSQYGAVLKHEVESVKAAYQSLAGEGLTPKVTTSCSTWQSYYNNCNLLNDGSLRHLPHLCGSANSEDRQQ